MDAETDAGLFERVQELFREAVSAEPEDVAAFLDRRCGGDRRLRRQVEALLTAHREAGSFLEDGPAAAGFGAAAGLVGRTIGAYRIVRRIGGGGMGEVYLAERADDAYRQRVAIKVLRPGEESEAIIRRFTTERQILAGLDHPNIAKLVDGGATDEGLPYIAMEYVEGKPIDLYCDDRRLDVRERLELFLVLCDAVGFAHSNLVVHRDLKPGNVTITGDGRLKLLDFGIAKLLNPELSVPEARLTVPLLAMLTPDYASPEQVTGGSITTATDVYSLGVLLYRLLAGRGPYRVDPRAPAEMLAAICHRTPEPPSVAVARGGAGEPDAPEDAGGDRPERERRPVDVARWRRALAGDLDAIVAKALRKTPEQRYSSVAALAEDLRRHLQGLPVRARRGTVVYRTGKFARRYRWPLTAAAALLVAMLGFGARLAWERDRSEAALAVAEVERERAERVSALLVDLFQAADPFEARDPLTRDSSVREFLERGAARIEQDAADPEVQAALRRTLGTAFGNLGVPDRAVPLLEASFEWYRGRGEGGRLDALETLHDLGTAYYQLGRFDLADSHYRQALDGFREHLGDRDPRVGAVLNDLAASTYQQRRIEEAESLFEQALAIRREPSRSPADLAETLHNLATVRLQSDLDSAVELEHEALAIRRRHYGRDHLLVANSEQFLARILLRQGRATEADEMAAAALRILRDNLDDGDWRISVVEVVRGGCLISLGRYAEAEPLLLGAYDNLRLGSGPRAGAARQALNGLVNLYEASGRPERAAEYRALRDPAGS